MSSKVKVAELSERRRKVDHFKWFLLERSHGKGSICLLYRYDGMDDSVPSSHRAGGNHPA